MNLTTTVTEGVALLGSFQIPNNYLRLSASTFIVIVLVAFVVRFVRYRQSFKVFTAGNLPGAPHSMLFGSITTFASVAMKCPQDAHPASIATEFGRKYGLKSIFALDFWPILEYPQLFVTDPEVANQVTVTNSLPKHYIVKKFVASIVGSSSMVLTEGAEWKKARRLFNPGFSIGHLSTLIPGIVNDTLVFRETLGKYADSGEVFQIEKEVAGLTVDIIGHIVLDHDMLAQTTNNEFVRYFRSAVHWSPSASNINPLINYNPILPIMMWYNTRRMDAYLMKVLDDRFSSRAHLAHNSTTRGKPAIDLALDEYTAEQTALGNSTGRVTDMAFKRFAIDQMKTFIFAGHDTTSSTVAYIYYLLHYHPEALAKLRKEFDDVFGDDIGATADLIKTKPLLINKLVYSTAVIKETLRLYPPASSVRQGDGAIKLDGHEYPAKGFMVWVVSHSIHRRPELFPSPDKFIPERFLPAPDNWQEVPKDAWRPFEKGPRACIGQELAMLETKIIMALTLRDFDIRGAFEEWDAKLGRKKPGDMLDGQRGMFGYRSYQVLSGSAKPVDSMPSVVKRRVFT